MFNKTTLGGRLRIARGRRTRTSTADEMGVNHKTLARWEQIEDPGWDGSQPKLPYLEKLADTYNCSLEWLKYGTGSMKIGREKAGDLLSQMAAESSGHKVVGGDMLDIYSLTDKHKTLSVRQSLVGPGIDESELMAIRVSGNCMEGVLSPGDTAIGVRYHYHQGLIDGSPYVIKVWDALSIRKMYSLPSGQVMFRCASGDFPDIITERRSGEVVIIARIIASLKMF